MNCDAADLRDELAKFKQYCDLIFSGRAILTENGERTSLVYLAMDWQARFRNL